jgi:hypothetical protein
MTVIRNPPRQNAEQPRGRWDVPVSPGWVKRTWLLLFSLLLSMILSPLLTGCSANAADWIPARDEFDAQVLEAIVTENSTIPPGSEDYRELIEDMRVRQLAPDLVAIDFNSPLLTGSLGVLLIVYRLDDAGGMEQVLYTHLDPALPEGYPLVRVTEREENGLPCLQLFQTQHYEGTVERYELCFDSEQYELRDTQAFPVEDADS